MLTQEYRTNEEVMQELGQKAANWFPRIVPEVLSVSIFIGGAILLFRLYAFRSATDGVAAKTFTAARSLKCPTFFQPGGGRVC
ncbi:MAG: hypothetical protein U5J95_03605 [Balneolaceae bacterium]|nr:hypothetical protein [Balneolaceae bacterium]